MEEAEPKREEVVEVTVSVRLFRKDEVDWRNAMNRDEQSHVRKGGAMTREQRLGEPSI